VVRTAVMPALSVADDVWAPERGGRSLSLEAGGGDAGGFAPLSGLGNVVVGLQLCSVALGAAMVGTELVYYAVDPVGFADSTGELGTPLGLALALGVGLIGLGMLAVTIFGMPVWVWWHWRAGSNLVALGIRHEHGPGAHAGWWFVPFANLVMPYRTMSELYASSANGPDDEYQVADSFPLWWGAWLVSNVLTNISFRLSMRTNLVEASLVLDCIAEPLSIVATLLYVRYVRKISAGQDQLAAAARTA
jgi:hypothetical protein